MKRLWRTLEGLAWGTFFVLAALVLGLRYGVLPQVERLRPQIVERVSAVVGLPVRIGRIEAEWNGLRPQLNLSDVRIYDAEGREALQVSSVEKILSWRSLAHGDLRLHALHVEGPKLTVRRDAAGAFYVGGVKLAMSGGSGTFGDWLFDQREIVVRSAQVEWRDEQRAAPPLVFTAIDLRLTNRGRNHSIGLVARLPGELGAPLKVNAELNGDTLAQLAGWNGRVYSEIGYTDAAALRPWVDYPFEIHRGAGALRAWTTIADGAPREVSADLALNDVAASLAPDLPALEVASTRARVHARRTDGGYELEVHKLELTPQGAAALQPIDFQLAWRAEGGVAAANSLEVAPLAHVAESLPLPLALRRAALELEPRGQLTEARYEWQGALSAPASYRAVARFADLGLSPREKVPGFAKLDGTFEASEAGGRVHLDSRGAEVQLPRVFPEPRTVFDTFTGEIQWLRDGERLRVDIPSLTLANADLSGNLFGNYTYDGSGPGRIDLTATFNRADAKNLAHYLPLGALMGDKTRAWLARGIVAGQASEVEVRLQGDLAHFPFDGPQPGRFRVAARVHDGELDYAEGWPRIRGIDAELVFEGDRMDITGHAGTILGAKLAGVKVAIPHLRDRGPRVHVSGEARGPTAEFLRFLQESELKNSAGRSTASLDAAGEGHLKLRLELPIADLTATKVAGEYDFTGNRLTLTSDLPPLEDAAGKVAFTDASLSVPQVRARIFGGPVTVTGGTRPNGQIDFHARGEAQPAALGALFDHPLRRALSGSAPYTATVSLRNALQRVVVDSSLRGVASQLPPPFEKAAAETLPLHVEFVPGESGATERIGITLGRVAAAEVTRRRQGEAMQLQRGSIWFGPVPGRALRQPERRGILVYGSLASLDADRWRAVMGGDDGGETLPTAIELRIARLDASGKRINNLALRGSADAAGWAATVDADEMAGQLNYTRQAGGKLTARLLHFTVPQSLDTEKRASSAKPSDLPAMDLVAERFTLGGKSLGRVELVGQRSGSDWRIDRLAILNSDATLLGTGRWRDGVVTTSELEFRLEVAEVGQFMSRVGYPRTVMGGKAEMQGALRWNGELTSLDYPSLAGDLRMSADDGEFLEIDPGLGKLISLMNLQQLPRRIQLDFRDVFSKGFRFDHIESNAHLERGVMDIAQFRMRGPAAEVAMSGKVDLASETQDLRVRVVPSLGGSAATAVAIVNPVAGVAAAVAQHVLKNPLGQIFAAEFNVSGGWAEPKVARLFTPAAPNPIATP
jgi:uncharacterized protein (TIGR02099 family)